MNLLKINERIDDLGIMNGKIIQNDELYCFANDPILLVNFSRVKKDAVVVDLCSGSGIIDILVALKSKAKKIYGIEMQQCMAEMSSRSVVINNLENKIQIINDTIQNYAKHLNKCCADVVYCNPPYFKKGHKNTCENEVLTYARHEIALNLEDVIKTASELLNSKGVFYLVHQACRLQEIFNLMSKHKMAVKEIMLVQARENCEPHLVLIKGVKDGAEELKVLPNLILNNADGSFTTEVNKLYTKTNI